MVCTLCKTSYNVLSHSHLCLGWGGGGGLLNFPGGGVVKKRESPDFRSPEVCISVDPSWNPYLTVYLRPKIICALFPGFQT